MGKPATKAHNKYNKKKYDDVKIRVLKGKREFIKKYAEENGTTINSLFIGLLREDMKKNGIDYDSLSTEKTEEKE